MWSVLLAAVNSDSVGSLSSEGTWVVMVSLGASVDDPAVWVRFQFSSKFGCWGSVMHQ
jgi:hypothetical protein